MIELTGALEAAAATTKPGEKMKAIEGLDSDNQKLLMLAQNPFITFGVKQIPEGDSPLFLVGASRSMSDFSTAYWRDHVGRRGWTAVSR